MVEAMADNDSIVFEEGEVLVWVTHELPVSSGDYYWDCKPEGSKYRFDGIDGDEVLLSIPGAALGTWGVQARFPRSILVNLARDRREGLEVGYSRAEEALRDGVVIREDLSEEVTVFLRKCHRIVMSSMGSEY